MKVKTWLTAWLLSFCISFGSVAALVTAFDLKGTVLLALGCFCFFLCAIFAGIFCFKKGPWITLGLTAAFLGYLLLLDSLGDSARALAYQLSVFFDAGYGWGTLSVPEWIKDTTSPQTALQALMLIPALTVCWTVCRPQKLLLSLPIALIPLYPCFALTDLVPDRWCLFLILSGVLVLVLTQTPRRLSLKTGNRITAIALIPAVLVSSLLVYRLSTDDLIANMPQISVDSFLSWWEELSGGESDDPAGAQSVDLSQTGPLPDQRNIVMSLRADFGGTVYLRQQVYDRYENNTWSVTEAAERFDQWPNGQGADRGLLTISTVATADTLLIPYYPQNPSVFFDVEDGAVPNPDKKDRYSYRVVRLPESGPVLSGMRYTAWTDLPLNILKKAQQILLENSLQSPEQIIEFVCNSADYDRQTDYMPAGKDFAIWFLEEAETGYCVHFATAAVVLLRAAGYNARYVTGYVAEVSPGRTTRVLGNQAHAWVEVLDYSTGGGFWKILEPTPGDAFSHEPEPDDPVTRPTPVPETEPTTEPVPSTQETTETVTESTAPTQGTDSGQVEKPQGNPVLLTLLGWLFGLAAAVLAIWLQRLIRLRLRLKRQRTGHPNTQALARWREICRLSRLLKTEPPAALLELAEKARFSQHTLTREELHSLGQHLHLQRRALDSLPAWKRFFLRLIWAV